LIDDILTFEFDNYIQQLITLGGLFAQMATSQPFLLIVIGGGIIIFYTIQRLFQHTAVAIQRLESVSRAPIFSHLSESIEGAPSIRAYALQKAFVRTNINKVDANIVDYLSLHYSTSFVSLLLAPFDFYFINLIANSCSWYGLRLDWVGTAIILATLLSVMITRDTGTLNVALAGLALSSTSAVTATLSNMAYSAITVDIVMNSVERIRQYTDVEQEAPAHIKETAPAPSWPEKGGVRFKNLTIEYTTGEPVLKGITATIKPREKVGIVGRTGAGSFRPLTCS
jgi:ABC-type multidrug transport system fused ATPase/permease subunit